jgi:phenylalanyl-tRNA synthetase beta chain
MRAPLSWIRDFTPADAPIDDLVAALNQLGLEVEGVEQPGREVLGVRVARILEVSPHPDADRLRLAEVDFGAGTTRVVCGAPNIAAGMLVPFAPSGASLPGGFTLERRKIRGQVSDGMLCSAKELGLGDDHGGIMELDADSTLGADVREVLGLDDFVFDLALTPNRPDAMCIVGVARELAAHLRQPLTIPEPVVATGPGTASATSDTSVEIEAPERCPRYLGWAATVTMGPSPAWLQQRLVKAGMRPISNVVDVTNYVLLERNQPLHAFDLSRLPGRGVVVRLAEPGEHITTLDEQDRVLDSADLLICDAERSPQAIAGIMGGATAEVSAATTEILLEAAYFERMGIARSSKRLKLRSEASARFERGIDPDGVATHAARAMELLVEVADAQVAPEAIDAYPRPFTRPQVALRTTKVNGVLGTDLTDTSIIDALVPLGIEVTGTGDELEAAPPSFRPDLEREIDLVEEVARRVGFDAIGRTVPRPRVQVGGLTRAQRDRRLIADALVGAGASEAMTIPLVAPAALDAFGRGTAVPLANPLRAEESVLRTALLPGLVTAVAFNAARGQPDVALFELGTVFSVPSGAGVLPDERAMVAAVVAGTVARRPVEDDRPVDVYDATDLLQAVARALGSIGLELEPTAEAGGAGDVAVGPGWHPLRAARISVAGQEIGTVGELAPEIVSAAGLAGPVVAFEADLGAWCAAPRSPLGFRAPSPFPPSSIDLAFVVAESVPAAAIASTLRGAGADLLEDLRVFDEFRSEALGAGLRSLAFSLRYRAPDRTLTDAEVGDLRRRSIEAVAAAHGATLRG